MRFFLFACEGEDKEKVITGHMIMSTQWINLFWDEVR